MSPQKAVSSTTGSDHVGISGAFRAAALRQRKILPGLLALLIVLCGALLAPVAKADVLDTLSSASPAPRCVKTGEERVWTGERGYPNNATVDIHGSGHAPGCEVAVKVTRPDGTVVKGDGTNMPGSDTVTTDAQGNFAYDYKLNEIDGWYDVETLGEGDEVLASTRFIDAFSTGNLFLGSVASANENYLFGAGDTLVADADVDANADTTSSDPSKRQFRYHKYFIVDPSGNVRNTPTCAANGTGGPRPLPYQVSANDPPSTSTDYTFKLRQYTGTSDAAGKSACEADSSGTGAREKENLKTFQLAKATAYSDSGGNTPKSSFAANSTAYVKIQGLEQSQSDYSTTWKLPSGPTACANTAGGDRPDTSSAGASPHNKDNTGGEFLQYRPRTTDSGPDQWNWESKYETKPCPELGSSNEGQWKLHIERDPKHRVTLNAFSVAAQKQNQTITFNQPPAKTYGDADFDPGATASSGLPVSYTSSTPDVCTIASAKVRLVSAGTCTVTAKQEGNESFNAAQDVARSFSVNKKNLTVSGASAENKVYDGNADATVKLDDATLNGVVGTDSVSLKTTGHSASFDNKNVGNAKPVTVTGVALQGTASGNYTVSQPSGLTANISKAELTGAFTAANKAYDGNRDATITGRSVEGKVAGENVDLDGGTATFDTKDAGTDKTVTGTGFTLAGTDKGNYTLKSATLTTKANITAKGLTISGAKAEDKVYDGSSSATVDFAGASLNGVVGGEDVSIDSTHSQANFATPNAGTGKAVTVTGVALGGSAAGNYTVSQPSGLTAAIKPKELTVQGAKAKGKVYDGTASATVDFGGASLAGVVNGESVSLRHTGYSAKFDDKNVGTAKPVTVTGIDLDGTDRGNYSVAALSGLTADITKAVLKVNAEDKTKAYGEDDPTLTSSLSGFKGSDTSSVVSGKADCSRAEGEDVGEYAITCSPGTLETQNYSFETGSQGKLTITKANSMLTYSGDASRQYSDKADLKATLKRGSTPLENKTVRFKIGTQEKEATTDSNGVAATTLKIDQTIGTPGVVASFAGDANHSSSSDSDPFAVKQEDARAEYTGSTFVKTSSATSSKATVNLAATIQDITAVTGDSAHDPDEGDIRHAKVEFVNRDNGAVICSPSIGLVNTLDAKTGTATCGWAVDIGTQDSLDYTVGVRVNGRYVRNSNDDTSVVTVSKPLTGFITGGGFLLNQSSAGQGAGETGKKTNFGFNVKRTKTGALQGRINTIVRNGGKVLQVKGNSMTTLSTNLTSPTTGTAIFEGKSSIQDISDPLNPQPVDGNATLRVTMTDAGEPGSSDQIGINIWNKSGGLWFSSNWSGTKTLEQLLKGGNLVVR